MASLGDKVHTKKRPVLNERNCFPRRQNPFRHGASLKRKKLLPRRQNPFRKGAKLQGKKLLLSARKPFQTGSQSYRKEIDPLGDKILAEREPELKERNSSLSGQNPFRKGASLKRNNLLLQELNFSLRDDQ